MPPTLDARPGWITAIAFSAGLALIQPVTAADMTWSYGNTSAGMGNGVDFRGDGGWVEDGPKAGPTSVNGHTRFSLNGVGYVDSRLEAMADNARLRARATVQTAAFSAYGTAGDDSGTVAGFEDRILIGGGGVGGTHSFRLRYSLTGFAGKTGTAAMQFNASLIVQAWGSGITITAAPPETGFSFPIGPSYSLSASGSEPRAFGDSDFLVISAADGATLNVSGGLKAFLSLRGNADSAAYSSSTLDIWNTWNTGAFSIEPISSGTTFRAASGRNYTVVIPERSYAAWAGGDSFNTDSNDDGVANGMAWLLGARDPNENALMKLPVASRNGANLRLTFRCLKSTKRGGTVLKVQTSSDLGVSNPWTNLEAVVPDVDSTVNGVIFDITGDGDFINVIADIPAAGGKIFCRLNAVSAP